MLARRALRPERRDLVLAASVAVVVTLSTALHAHALGRPVHPVGYAVLVVAALALAWRRRWPLPVLAVTVGTVLPVYAVGSVRGPAMAVVAIAACTVAARVRWAEAVGVGVALVALWACVDWGVGWSGQGVAALGSAPWLALFVAVGVAVGAVRRSRAVAAAHAEEQRRRRLEQERLRLAQEVHDVVSHSLAMINLQAGVGLHVASRRPEQAVAALREIREASGVALADLRATVAMLRDPADLASGEPAEPAGTAGLHRLAEVVRVGEAAGLEVALHGDVGRLPGPVDTAAFRIVQEAVTNVVRHARDARHLTIEVRRRDGRLHLAVGDDGRAVDAPLHRHGLLGMAERAAALGGSAHAGPAERGFEVRAVIPLGGP